MKTQLMVLPDQSYFELSELARDLADLCPAAPDSVKGLDCITHKLIPKFSLDKSPQFLYRKPFVLKQVLSDDDGKILGEILQRLPPVTHFMTYKQIESFFDCYYKLDKRPRWEPYLMLLSDRENMQRDYQRRLHTHCQQFADMAEKGEVMAIDRKFDIVSAKDWPPESIKQKKLLVTKRDALTFLSTYGLKVSFEPQITKSPSEPTTRRPKADLLTAIIEDLYRQYGQDSEDIKIWLEVTKMAAAETHPFKSFIGGDIFFRDDEKLVISKKSFMARLSRRKERALKYKDCDH